MTFVRVRLPNGYETTLSAAFVEGTPGLEVLDEPATNSRGLPLKATRKNGRPVKTRTSVSKEAAKKVARKSDPGPSDETPDGLSVESAEEASE